MKRPDHSTATTTGGLPTIEEAMKGAAETDALVASDLAGMVYTCAQVAIDEAATTGDPCWAEAAASLVKALFEVGHAGRPGEPAPETTLEERHPRPWKVEPDMDKIPRVRDANGLPVAVGLGPEKRAYVATYNREPLLLEIAALSGDLYDRLPSSYAEDITQRLATLLDRLRQTLATVGGGE